MDSTKSIIALVMHLIVIGIRTWVEPLRFAHNGTTLRACRKSNRATQKCLKNRGAASKNIEETRSARHIFSWSLFFAVVGALDGPYMVPTFAAHSPFWERCENAAIPIGF